MSSLKPENNSENGCMQSRITDIFINKCITILIGLSVIIVLLSLVTYRFSLKNTQHISNSKGDKYLIQGDYNKALEEYEKSYKKDGALVWKSKIAGVYSLKDDKYKTIQYVEEIKNSDKREPKSLSYVTYIQLINGDYKKALTDGEEFLKENPKDKTLITSMFSAYLFNKEYEKAKKLLKSYPLDDKSSYDMAKYSDMLMNVGEEEKALEYLKKAWHLNKDEYKIYDVIVHEAMNNKNKVLDTISKLSIKEPEELAYRMWRAKVYSRTLETVEEAEKIMESLKGKDIGKIVPKAIESSILMNKGEKDKAQEVIDNLLKENKNDYRAYHTAAWFYLSKGDLKKAEEYCIKSIYENQNYVDNYALLMPEILRKQKDNESDKSADTFFYIALCKEPYNGNIMMNTANYFLEKEENMEKVLKYFKMAELVKPLDAELKYNIALTYISEDENKEAEKVLRECIKISPETAKYNRTLGTIYFLSGNNTEAIKEIKEAYKKDENDPLTLNNAGCYYITVNTDLERGMYNLRAAKNYSSSKMDKYNKKTIDENYERGKKLLDQYKKAKGNEKLGIPEFVLFY
ncbi:tetratricopeptide repeat protein [Clostridium cochlearium]|uniref:Tetratricopeptide repeat protein n=1 Tax=Clostridium cochlearium TaxID=1494 RepID=A0A7Y3Y0J5_CLOCO|nr:tetratricopeptide repeat protein [Clostridium cochlearium]NOH17195.1 tetratricopeptide repeat protein [Clostridium cochlearium]